MIETIRERLISNAPVAAAGLALAALSGCGETNGLTPDQGSRGPELPRCFETPHDPETDFEKPSEPPDPATNFLTLRREPDGRLRGAAVATPGIEEQARGAAVKVKRGPSAGSGVLVGAQVVVTAGHVAAGSRELAVVDSRGKTAKVIGGCYMFDAGDGHFGDLSRGDSVPIDVAVLRLDNKLGTATLPVAYEPLGRGERSFFVNYQSKRTPPTFAAWYEGVGLTPKNEPVDSFALSGIEPQRYAADVEPYTVRPGASGGGVINPETGEIVGISVGNSVAEGGATRSLNADELNRGYGVRFSCVQPQGDERACDLGAASGILPVLARLVQPRFIRQALDAAGALPAEAPRTTARTPTAQGTIYLDNAKLPGSFPNQRHPATVQAHRYPAGRQPGRRFARQRARA